jgi:hypothetical protein
MKNDLNKIIHLLGTGKLKNGDIVIGSDPRMNQLVIGFDDNTLIISLRSGSSYTVLYEKKNGDQPDFVIATVIKHFILEHLI